MSTERRDLKVEGLVRLGSGTNRLDFGTDPVIDVDR